jgi:large-conductance mechanosensitive channel
MENTITMFVLLAAMVFLIVFTMATVNHLQEMKRIKEQFKNTENETSFFSCYTSSSSNTNRILD